MPDSDMRAAGFDMRESSREPAADYWRLLGGDLFGGSCPAFDELPLEPVLFRRQCLIARFAAHLIAHGGKAAFGAPNAAGSRRPAESLVVGHLVPVHEIPNRVVFGFDGRASRATVVVQREECCG